MSIPVVIDNQRHCVADALEGLLAQSVGKPLDSATAYFAIPGYRLVKEGLHQVGAFRLLLGAELHSGADVGLKPIADALKRRLQGDLEAEPFNAATSQATHRRVRPGGDLRRTVRRHRGCHRRALVGAIQARSVQEEGHRR